MRSAAISQREERRIDKNIGHTDALAGINQRIVSAGEILPAVRLAAGSRVQMGTVAAMLRNVQRFNDGERGQVEVELRMAIPTMTNVGLSEFFSPDEWIGNTGNAARRFVGECAKAYLSSPDSIIDT